MRGRGALPGPPFSNTLRLPRGVHSTTPVGQLCELVQACRLIRHDVENDEVQCLEQGPMQGTTSTLETPAWASGSLISIGDASGSMFDITYGSLQTQ